MENNIKIYIKGIVRVVGDWIQLIQRRDEIGLF
jgi:hypothetical protein